MDDRRFDRIIQTWSARALRGGASVIGPLGGEARRKRGLKAGKSCDPARPHQCRSGICGGAGGASCVCRIPRCVGRGKSCRKTGNFDRCAGVGLAASDTCIA